MSGLVASFHLVATLIFVLVSLVVAVRMLTLARRTGMRPELFLGLGLLGTAVLGYGVLIAGAIARGSELVTDAVTPRALQALGQLLHDAGVVMILLFVRTVFRPGDRWAGVLVGCAAAALAIGQIGWESVNRFRDASVGNAFWWLRYLVIWTYPIWTAVESFRWYGIMQKRSGIGLADPLVTNRFFLWGAGSIGTLLAIWTSSFPLLLLGSGSAAAIAWTPAVHVATALFGVVTVSLYYLTFFPPVAYRRWVSSPS